MRVRDALVDRSHDQRIGEDGRRDGYDSVRGAMICRLE